MIFNTNSKEYQLYFHYIKSVSSLSKLFIGEFINVWLFYFLINYLIPKFLHRLSTINFFLFWQNRIKFSGL